MSKVTEALEVWRQAVRQLEATMPGTPDWYQARLEAEERRAVYQSAVADSRRSQPEASKASEFVTPDSPVLARNVPSAVRSTPDGEIAQRDPRPRQAPLSRR